MCLPRVRRYRRRTSILRGQTSWQNVPMPTVLAEFHPRFGIVHNALCYSELCETWDSSSGWHSACYRGNRVIVRIVDGVVQLDLVLEVSVIVVALRESIEPRLQQFGCMRDFSILQVPSAEHAFRIIMRLRPRVVVVQVSQSEEETLRLVRLLANAAQPIYVIAVGTQHDGSIERAVWKARPTCYLPNAETGLLDRVLDAILVEDKRV